MTKIDEAKARIEAAREIKAPDPCPRCGKDNCACFTSGEFWDLQRRLRAAETGLKMAIEALRQCAEECECSDVARPALEKLGVDF